MQSNLSYLLLFCCFFFVQIGFSQDIKPTVPISAKDSIPIKKTDSLFLRKKDSLFTKKKDTASIDSLKPKESIEDIITHIAKDYTIQNAKDKTVTLYNEANITYTDIDLKAGIIIVDYKIINTGYKQRRHDAKLAYYTHFADYICLYC